MQSDWATFMPSALPEVKWNKIIHPDAHNSMSWQMNTVPRRRRLSRQGELSEDFYHSFQGIGEDMNILQGVVDREGSTCGRFVS